jgi:hypothetical protein
MFEPAISLVVTEDPSTPRSRVVENLTTFQKSPEILRILKDPDVITVLTKKTFIFPYPEPN